MAAAANAEVVRLTVEQRQPFQNAAQPYEKLTGRFFGELDPKLPQNAVITDIELAPRNARGMVEYSADFTILKPVDMSKATGVLVYNVPNRGAHQHRARWLLRRFPRGRSRAGGQRLAGGPRRSRGVSPSARSGGGDGTRPRRRSADDGGPHRAESRRLEHHRSRDGALLRRAGWRDDAADHSRPGHRHGDPGEPRHHESHADPAHLGRGRARADCADRLGVCRLHADAVSRHAGSRPSCASRTGSTRRRSTSSPTSPRIRRCTAIGFAATRDLIAFLRRHDADHPLGATVRHAIAQGTSQSGNYLRSFLNLGFNQDERGRRVFDGMNPNIAARQLAMNIRFAAPSGAAEMFEPGSEGVLWWEDYTDAARGRQAGGLLARCRASDTCPKIVETFGSAEFYSLRMSPNLVGTRADKDIPLPANVRRYYSPSTRHGGGGGGFAHEIPVDPCCMLATNPNPSNETNRALMKALVDVGGQGHAAAAQPLSDAREGRSRAARACVHRLPGDPRPAAPRRRVRAALRLRLRPGLQVRRRLGRDGAAAAGRCGRCCRSSCRRWTPTATSWPACAACCSRCRSAPTRAGTRLRAGSSRGDIQALGGGYIPFAKTKAQRLASGDPRLSLEERYGTHDAYVAQREGGRRSARWPRASCCRTTPTASSSQAETEQGAALSRAV